MHEIEGRVSRDILQDGALLLAGNRIPAHVRDADRRPAFLQMLVETHAAAFDKAEGRRVVLVAVGHHDLAAEADPKQGPARRDDIAQHGVEAGILKVAHGLSGSAHAGENHAVRAVHDGGIGSDGAGNAQMIERAAHAGLVPRLVVKDGKHSSSR